MLEFFPLFIHIQLNLPDLLFLQVPEPSLFEEILLDRQAAGFMIDRVSLPIFDFEKGKDVCFDGEDGQLR